jgi:hypothetical protein
MTILRSSTAILATLACLALSACIRVRVHDTEALGITRCTAPEQARDRWVLYLGRATADGATVDPAAWNRFRDAVVTPALPSGFTWHDASGQWRADDGATWREPSWVIVALAEPGANAAVRQIAEAYRRTFAQQAVLIERTRVCTTLVEASP